MHLVLVGLNHHTAPIEVRERLAFPETGLRSALAALRRQSGVYEAAILSTCNRCELYSAVSSVADSHALAQFLSQFHSVPVSEFQEFLYQYADGEAAVHLMRVASGLDSLVLGEPQILRQVRDAFAAGTDAGSIGPLLNGLFRAAIAAGKRARTETDIGRGGFSVGHAAVDLARSIFGSLQDAAILILGAGKMSELTARHLVTGGAGVVLVANRTHDKAQSLAAKLGGTAIRYDEFPERLVHADIVISSTAAPHHVVTRDTLAPVLRRRRGRPLFLIDIAVPRDIAPDVADLPNVFLYDLDDLEAVVADMARERAAEVTRVEAIIAEEAERYMAWVRSLESAPILEQLNRKHEQIRQAELARLRNQLGDLPDYAWERIEAATRSMLTRIARDPIRALKAAAAGQEPSGPMDLLTAARHLFGIGNGHSGPNSPSGTEAAQDQETVQP
ncbi:MAG: glutamyl-tRNA reductase [Chthonomonadales bacterium]